MIFYIFLENIFFYVATLQKHLLARVLVLWYDTAKMMIRDLHTTMNFLLLRHEHKKRVLAYSQKKNRLFTGLQTLLGLVNEYTLSPWCCCISVSSNIYLDNLHLLILLEIHSLMSMTHGLCITNSYSAFEMLKCRD